MSHTKPARWKDPENKLFPHQLGFAVPPHGFDTALTGRLSIAPA